MAKTKVLPRKLCFHKRILSTVCHSLPVYHSTTTTLDKPGKPGR